MKRVYTGPSSPKSRMGAEALLGKLASAEHVGAPLPRIREVRVPHANIQFYAIGIKLPTNPAHLHAKGIPIPRENRYSPPIVQHASRTMAFETPRRYRKPAAGSQPASSQVQPAPRRSPSLRSRVPKAARSSGSSRREGWRGPGGGGEASVPAAPRDSACGIWCRRLLGF